MREYSAETERVFKSLIDWSVPDFPHTDIRHSDYGTYKVRLGTSLMVAIGAKYSKHKIGFNSDKEFFDDIKIATAIAHEPFSDINKKSYLSRETIEKQTGEIIKYFLLTLKDHQDKIYLS